jgi:hypothetical protein
MTLSRRRHLSSIAADGAAAYPARPRAGRPESSCMRPAPPIIAGLIGIVLALPARAGDVRLAVALPAPPPGKQHFVDFRARSGAMLGHTYVVYGRTNRGGRVLAQRHAGLYPHDRYSDTVLLPVLLMPGYVGVEKKDRNNPPSAIYRRWVSAAQFRQLEHTVRGLQASQPSWHMMLYNCNDFASQVAHAMGLWTPPSLMPPNAYVRALAAMNGP